MRKRTKPHMGNRMMTERKVATERQRSKAAAARRASRERKQK